MCRYVNICLKGLEIQKKIVYSLFSYWFWLSLTMRAVTSRATPAKRTDAITKADFMFDDDSDDGLTQLVPHWYDRLVFICLGRSNIRHQQMLPL